MCHQSVSESYDSRKLCLHAELKHLVKMSEWPNKTTKLEHHTCLEGNENVLLFTLLLCQTIQ